MALSPEDFDAQWLAAMQQQQPYGMGPPPVQQIAPPLPQPVVETPAMPMPESDPALEQEWLAAMSAPPPPGPVGFAPPVDAYGTTIDQPEPDLVAPPDFDPFAPTDWVEAAQPQPLDPVGHVRTSAGEGEESLSVDELLQLNPMQRARYDAEQDSKLADLARVRQAEIQRADAERAEQEWRDYQDAKARTDSMMEKALADSEALANEKPAKFMDSVGNAVGAVLGIALGQFGAAATGGRNVGLDMVNTQIERHIAAQRDEYNRKAGAVDRRMNLIARLRDQGYTDYQAATVFRMAALGRARAGLLTEMQNFDPRGTTARNIANTIKQTEMQLMSAAEAARRQSFEDDLKASKDAREWADLNLKAQKQRGMGGVGGAGTVKPGNLSTEEVRGQINDPAFPVPAKPGGYTPREAANLVDLYKKGREVRDLDSVEKRREETEVRELGIGIPGTPQLMNKDGKPFKARDKTVAEKLVKQANAAGEVVDIIDEILAIRDRVGGESSAFNSDDRQRLDVLQNQLIILQKSGTEGMSSDEDMKKIANAAGAGDVASFRARAAGLEKGRERVVSMLNRTLRGAQYTGDPINFTNRYANSGKKTKQESELSQLIAKPQVSVDEATRQAMSIVRKNYPPGKLTNEQASALNKEAAAFAADYKGISPAQKDGFRRKGELAAGEGPEADRARADLEYAAKNGQTEEIRTAAQAALHTITSKSEPGVTTVAPVDLSNFAGGK